MQHATVTALPSRSGGVNSNDVGAWSYTGPPPSSTMAEVASDAVSAVEVVIEGAPPSALPDDEERMASLEEPLCSAAHAGGKSGAAGAHVVVAVGEMTGCAGRALGRHGTRRPPRTM